MARFKRRYTGRAPLRDPINAEGKKGSSFWAHRREQGISDERMREEARRQQRVSDYGMGAQSKNRSHYEEQKQIPPLAQENESRIQPSTTTVLANYLGSRIPLRISSDQHAASTQPASTQPTSKRLASAYNPVIASDLPDLPELPELQVGIDRFHFSDTEPGRKGPLEIGEIFEGRVGNPGRRGDPIVRPTTGYSNKIVFLKGCTGKSTPEYGSKIVCKVEDIRSSYVIARRID